MALHSQSFVQFLKGLSDDMKKQDVNDIIFLCGIPDGEAERLTRGYDIFKWLIRQGKLSENNLQVLLEIFNHIYRKDLQRRVCKYDQALKQETLQNQVMPPVSANTPVSGLSHSPTCEPRQASTVVPFTRQKGRQQLFSPSDFLRKKEKASELPTESLYSTPGKTIGGPQESPGPGPSRWSPEEKLSTQAEVEESELDEPSSQTEPNTTPIVVGITERSLYPTSLDYDGGTSPERRPLKRYPMSNKPHGRCVIISNRDFSKARNNPEVKLPHLEDRDGTEKDVENLVKTFKWLQFEVEVYEDKGAHDMWKVLLDYHNYDHKEYDCFVCIILTHGNYTGVLGVDGKVLNIKQLLGLFNSVSCPTLSGKPKLFFIQACRGDERDTGYKPDSMEDLFSANAIPNEGDFFIGYATPPGYVSWRHPEKGTWFISKLCEVFVDNAESYDLNTLMVIVNDEVSRAYSQMGFYQIPSPSHTLRKAVYFFPMSLDNVKEALSHSISSELPSLTGQLKGIHLN